MSRCAPLDPSIIAHAQAGDTASRDRLMALLDPWLRILAARFRPEALEYEDACQDARLAVLVAFHRYRPERMPLTLWCQLTVRQQYALWRRDQARHKRCVLRAPHTPEDLEALASAQPAIARAIQRNPFPAALDRAFLSECRRIVPAEGLTETALTAYLRGEELAVASKERGFSHCCLGQRMHAWIRSVRYRLGFEAAPAYSRRRGTHRRAEVSP